ncbi:MAG: hypothetical protein H7X80_11210 [bacterium]|nr:hypothetical protein [Candidatus Kapabacteria bacterium]
MLRLWSTYVATITLTLFVAGCASDTIVDPSPRGTTNCDDGDVLPFGASINGYLVSLPAAGGTFESTDRRMKVFSPPHPGDYPMQIETIVSTVPLGVGRAYRIQVIDTNTNTVNYPFTYTFKYNARDIEGTTPSALGIAYQDNNGVWKAVGATHNPQDSTLSVTSGRVQRWAMFAAFRLGSDDSPVVQTGGTYTATMYTQPNIAKLDTLSLNGSVPLCAPVESDVLTDVRIVAGGGGAAGPGSGSASQSGGSATYSAPNDIPANSWLSMVVRWPSRYHWGDVEVYNHIWIGSVIEFFLEGKFYSLEVLPPIAYSHTATGRTSVSGATRPGVSPVNFINLSFKLMDEGTHSMRNTGDVDSDDLISVNIGEKHYFTYLYECLGGVMEQKFTDLGTVHVTAANRERRYITGTFSGRIAAHDGTKFFCGSHEVERWSEYQINGTFRCAWGIL